MHPLISAWKEFNIERAPYILSGDERLIAETQLYCRFAGWDDFIANPDFGAPGVTQLHLDLLPVPYVGNILKASIYLLMLNPGFGPHDYFGEYIVPEYRSAMLDNLRQTPESYFFVLDPRFAWHGGFTYWHTKLRYLINAFGNSVGLSYGQARQIFQSQLAAIELSPYHSVDFAIPNRILKTMRSVQLIKSFVREELLPRAGTGDCLLIVTRAAKHWNILEGRGVIAYGNTEARSAYLGPNTRGGAAILKFLKRQY